jgi:hypothetical protein
MSDEREGLMRIEVHLYFHQDQQISSQLLQISQKLDAVKLMEDQMDVDIQALITQAAANTNAESAAVTLLNSLFAQLTAALAGTGPISAADRAAIQAQVATLASSATAMGAAIVQDTPAATGASPAAPAAH